MKIVRLYERCNLSNLISEGSTLGDIEMKTKQHAMLTLALSLAGAANAGGVNAPDAPAAPRVLQVVRMQSSSLLHGTLDSTAINNAIAAAYSNAALAYWRAGALRASREFMGRAKELAPNESFVLANAAYLMSLSVEGASLAKN